LFTHQPILHVITFGRERATIVIVLAEIWNTHCNSSCKGRLKIKLGGGV
jgi:hypothetical protein